MKNRVFAIVISLICLAVCCSCSLEEKISPQSQNEHLNSQVEGRHLDYITTTCEEVQASTRISVVDGKVYCMWLKPTYSSDGRAYDTYFLNVFENGSWKNISTSNSDMDDSSLFDKIYKYPLNEKVGTKTVYTDDKNDFYLRDEETKEIIDLRMNLKDWRAFATDGKSVFAVLSAYCNKDSKAEIRIYDISQISEEGLLNFSQNITKSDILEQDDNIYYLKEKLSSKEQRINFDTFNIDVKDSCGNKISWFVYIDDTYGYYSRSAVDGKIAGEIGRVNIENNTYEKLVDIPIGNQSAAVVASKDYIVWEEQFGDYIGSLRRLNIYDIAQKTNKIFYNNAVDSIKGTNYSWDGIECVIEGDTIYFDDIVGVEDKIFSVNLYSYDAKTCEINLIKEKLERPRRIREGFILQELNKDRADTDIALYKNEEVIKELSSANSLCTKITTAKNGSIVATYGLSSDAHDIVNCHGVQIYNNKKVYQLFVTKDCVYAENVTDGNMILFSLNTSHKHKPLIFDIKSDKFIELDCEKNMYAALMSNSYGYFLSHTQDGMKIIRIKLSDWDN